MNECLHPVLAYKTGLKTKTGKDAYYLDLQGASENYRLEVKPWMRIDYVPYDPSICVHDDIRHCDFLTKYVKLPCGKCIACQMNKSIDLSTRLYLEAKQHDNYYFLTLTYKPEVYSLKRDFKRDFQLFMKRFRKKLSGKKLRFFATFEHGDIFGRGHFHAIIYFDEKIPDVLQFLKMSGKNPLFRSSLVEQCWEHGYSYVGTSCDSIAALNYVSKYCVKKLGLDDGFYLSSRKPGLGAGAVSDIDNNFIIVDDGKTVKKRPLPHYIYDKLEEANPDLYQEIREMKRLFVNHAYNYPKPQIDKIANQEFIREELTRNFILAKQNILAGKI